MKRNRIYTLFTLVLFASQAIALAEDEVDYASQVKPLLKAHCFACHGGLKSESDLRLDSGSLILKGGAGGSVLVPGKPVESSLIERLVSDDEDLRMPQQGRALRADEVEVLSRWIQEGARFPADDKPEDNPLKHWSFVAPRKGELPTSPDATWNSSAIDRLIAAGHRRHDVTAVLPAPPAVLLRRVYLDLIGVPPSAEQVQAFLEAPSDAAYAAVVDQLLDDPRYGERWGRHWMDVWRYSDWYGRRQVNDVRNSYPHIWRWRDWIVQSLNEDKGYEQMLREMLAADELYPDDDQRVVATGFLVRNWFSLNYDIWMRDIVEHTGKAFLGLRFNCALCHDHKYDPISQEDYFRMRAFFEPLEVRNDRVPGGPRLAKYIRYKPGSGASLKPISAGLARIYDHTLDAETYMYQLGDQRDLFPDRPPVDPGVPSFLGKMNTSVEEISLPAQASYPGLKPFIQTEELKQRQDAVVAASKAWQQLGEQNVKQIETARDAVRTAEETLRLRIKEAQENPADRPPADDVLSKAIAHWDFEVRAQSDENTWLQDRTTVQRKLTMAPDATSLPSRSRAESWSSDSAFHRLASGRDNKSAAFFDPAAAASSGLQTPEPIPLGGTSWSFAALVRMDKTELGLQQVIAAVDGQWALVTEGKDTTAAQLRLLYASDGAWRAAAKLGEKEPLSLEVGREYLLAVTASHDQATISIRDLKKTGPLQVQPLEGLPKMVTACEIQLRVGDVDGSAWWQGLIDEVVFWDGVLGHDEIAAIAGAGREEPAVLEARLALEKSRARLAELVKPREAAELALRAAEAELEAISARIAADNAVYRGENPDGVSLDELKSRASKAVRVAALATADSAVLQKELQIGELKQAEMVDTKALDAAEKELAMLQTAAGKARKAVAVVSTAYELLSPTYPSTSTGRRRALADWVSSRQNPLTARVAVNHIWMRHFGRALVASVADLGRSGKLPTHPELLDWLAVELMENGWSMKHLHRQIVLSRTYRLGTVAGPEREHNLLHDKDNQSWWRMEDRRLEAEVIRDSLLSVSGELDVTMGGPVQDPAEADKNYRRSLYFSIYPEGGGQIQMLGLFDPPDPCDCYQRSTSVMPQQSLALVNSRLVLDLGRRLTARLTQQHDVTDEVKDERGFVAVAFLSVLSRPASDQEMSVCLSFLARQRELLEQTPLNADATPSGHTPPAQDFRVRARESLIHALMNHHDFVTIH